MDISSKISKSIPDGYKLVKSTDPTDFIIALLSLNTCRVVYYIECSHLNDINFTTLPITQVALWRTGDYTHYKATHEIASSVFNDYLLTEYMIAASDSNHTTEGKDFWVRQTSIALCNNKHVYRYDEMHTTLDEITDHEIIATDADRNWIWGDTPEYNSILLIISNSPCKLNKHP